MTLAMNNIPTNGAENTLIKNNKRLTSRHNQIVTIGSAGAALALDVAYPIGFNKVTSKHTPWVAPDPTELVIYLGTTAATGGTWGITVNSNAVEVDIAFDATAAEVVAALKGMGYDITCVLSQTTAADDTYTLTFDGQPEVEVLPTVVGTVTDLTGDTASSATTTVGTATAGADRIRGFVNPEPAQSGVTAGSGSAVVLSTDTDLCTITTVAPHGFVVGDTYSATMSGATEAKLNITATITILSPTTFSYPVAAVSGGTTETAVAFTTTNDAIATIMTKGDIHYQDVADLIAAASLTALQTAMRADLMPDGIAVQGLTAVH